MSDEHDDTTEAAIDQDVMEDDSPGRFEPILQKGAEVAAKVDLAVDRAVASVLPEDALTEDDSDSSDDESE